MEAAEDEAHDDGEFLLFSHCSLYLSGSVLGLLPFPLRAPLIYDEIDISHRNPVQYVTNRHGL